MKRCFVLFLLAFCTAAGFTAVQEVRTTDRGSLESPAAVYQGKAREVRELGYCTVKDLQDAYGAERINSWARHDPAATDRAINNAGAEIDGYLLSGGYTVPLPGVPENLKKYCIDIATANLVIGIGVFEDTGDKEILEQAKQARRFLEKVAEGKFKIPGYSAEGAAGGETSKPPPGGVLVSSREKLDLRGY
jgi:phage gp36-like protein